MVTFSIVIDPIEIENCSYGNSHTKHKIGTKIIRNVVNLLGKFMISLYSI